MNILLRPDIEAWKDGRRHFFKVETCKSIESDETLRQLEVFSEGSKNSAFIFVIFIPESCYDTVESYLRQRNIHYDKLLTYN